MLPRNVGINYPLMHRHIREERSSVIYIPSLFYVTVLLLLTICYGSCAVMELIVLHSSNNGTVGLNPSHSTDACSRLYRARVFMCT